MNNKSVAPCGVICDICLGFQRTKNKCVGCNSIGNKPYHCTVCSIKACPEKMVIKDCYATNAVSFLVDELKIWINDIQQSMVKAQ